MTTAREKALAEFQRWYDELPTVGRPPAPAKGSIAVGLVLLERLKGDFNLDLQAHLAPGGAQIQGASGTAVRDILAEFGEMRPFVSERGRTNRGTPTIARNLLEAIDTADLASLPRARRVAILREMQGALVEQVREFHNRRRLKPVFDPSQSTRQFISDLLGEAEETGKHGPVAKYLVGAKLHLRFPDIEVRNESYAAADDPSGQPGDFVIADTAFHVTVAPNQGHFDKCQRNLRDGLRVFMLVPDAVLPAARALAELASPGQIAVESIESFVANSIEMEARGSAQFVINGLSALARRFNELVV
jgi:hypothetical protein